MDAVREALSDALGGGKRKPGLADAARPRQRDQPYIAALDQLAQPVQRVVAADQLSRLNRQVRPIERLERWELTIAELEESQLLIQILQAVQTEVAHMDPVHELPRGVREQHLPPVSHGRDPGRPVNVHPDVPLGRDDRQPRVQTHPHADRATTESRLARQGGGDRITGARERE